MHRGSVVCVCVWGRGGGGEKYKNFMTFVQKRNIFLSKSCKMHYQHEIYFLLPILRLSERCSWGCRYSGIWLSCHCKIGYRLSKERIAAILSRISRKQSTVEGEDMTFLRNAGKWKITWPRVVSKRMDSQLLLLVKLIRFLCMLEKSAIRHDGGLEICLEMLLKFRVSKTKLSACWLHQLYMLIVRGRSGNLKWWCPSYRADDMIQTYGRTKTDTLIAGPSGRAG